MKAKFVAAALLVTVFFVGIGSQVSAAPWHGRGGFYGRGYFRPHVAVRVGIPAPVVVAGGYYGGGAYYEPGYCPAPAPVVVGGGYYGRPYYNRPVYRGYYGGR